MQKYSFDFFSLLTNYSLRGPKGGSFYSVARFDSWHVSFKVSHYKGYKILLLSSATFLCATCINPALYKSADNY